MSEITENRERIKYAFGHLVASLYPDDPHHADSGELAHEVFSELNLFSSEVELLEIVAEYVQMRGERELS